MKFLSRITALTVLLSPALLAHLPGRGAFGSPEFPFLRPATPENVRQMGSLRFSIARGSLQSFNQAAESSGLDYELLQRFARSLGVGLTMRATETEEEAGRLLRSGMVDLAVLPGDLGATRDVVSTDPCPERSPSDLTSPRRLTGFVRSDSTELAQLVSGASREIADGGLDERLFALYCRADEAPDAILPRAERISRYSRMIAKYSAAAGLDWRLVAALIYEESSFEEKAVSAAGARGLMQLMPAASAAVGVANITRPEANIQAGVLYLRRLSDQFHEAPPKDRAAMTLAAYLLGPGHVVDAQDLARELGLNPRSWRRGLEETLPLLEDQRFYGRTRLGFAHGRQAVEYANRVLERYELYQQHLDRHPDVRATSGGFMVGAAGGTEESAAPQKLS
jgi:membrane-bound lytic murein transglycosylase MltF